MPRNTVTEQFRQSATEDQWRRLVSDHDMLSKEQFVEKYHFSWSSIMNDAADKGYYEKKRQRHSSSLPLRNQNGSEAFYVADRPADRKKVFRSVQLDEDIYARLQALEREKDNIPTLLSSTNCLMMLSKNMVIKYKEICLYFSLYLIII